MTQRERIVEQASQMFVRQGIKAVRMDDIAHALGVSKRTLYELFGDKEELLTLSIVRFFRERRERHAEIAAGTSDVLEALFVVLNEILNTSATAGRLLANLKKFYPAVYARVMRDGEDYNSRCFREMLEKGIADGLFIAGFNIDLAISVLYYTASGLMDNRDRIVPPGMNEREAFIQLISCFFRGIATQRGLALVDEYARRCRLSLQSNTERVNE